MSQALLNIKAWEYAVEQAKPLLNLPDDTCKCHFDVKPLDSELLFKGGVYYDDRLIGYVYIDEGANGELIKKFELKS